MSDKPTILVQLDTDPQPSVFDRVVAVDAGRRAPVQLRRRHAGARCMPLVHGCIFTRGPKDLQPTADLRRRRRTWPPARRCSPRCASSLIPQYGLTVSVMLDSNGSNTTAAAAVRAAASTSTWARRKSLVLGGTGPVGQRVARLLARHGGHVRVGSRPVERAKAVCDSHRAEVARRPGRGRRHRQLGGRPEGARRPRPRRRRRRRRGRAACPQKVRDERQGPAGR